MTAGATYTPSATDAATTSAGVSDDDGGGIVGSHGHAVDDGEDRRERADEEHPGEAGDDQPLALLGGEGVPGRGGAEPLLGRPPSREPDADQDRRRHDHVDDHPGLMAELSERPPV